MPKTYFFIFLFCFSIAYSAFSAGKPDSANGRLTAVPSVTAYDLNGASIKIDGVLDEEAWQHAELATGFRIWSPNRGNIPIVNPTSEYSTINPQSILGYAVTRMTQSSFPKT